MSKINETNYPRRTQANYADTDMLVIQAAGGNTYTTRLEDMREDYEATLAPTLSALQDDINENLATIEAGSTASKVYAKGDYLVFGGKLCRVTSTSIAAGATLTIGTNIELAPVGDELKTLSSELTNLIITKQQTLTNFEISPGDNSAIVYNEKPTGYIPIASYIDATFTGGNAIMISSPVRRASDNYYMTRVSNPTSTNIKITGTLYIVWLKTV